MVTQDDVIAVLKTLQQSTRCLHHYCSHSKVEKDTRLVNHVPPLKRSLEFLVFKVKVCLLVSMCVIFTAITSFVGINDQPQLSRGIPGWQSEEQRYQGEEVGL